MSMWQPGEDKIRPGVYVRVVNAGEPPIAGVPQGTVAIALAASWGPTDAPRVVNRASEGYALYGQCPGTDALNQAFRGGALTAVVMRAGGSGGAAGTLTLTDASGTPAPALDLTATSPGARALGVRLVDAGTGAPLPSGAGLPGGTGGTGGARARLVPREAAPGAGPEATAAATQREFSVYDQTATGWALLSRVTIPKGATGQGEAAALQAALAGNPYVTAAPAAGAATGPVALADVGAAAPTLLTGGTDPTVDAAAYVTAFQILEGEQWNVLLEDTGEIEQIQALIDSVDDNRQAGRFRMGVVGEPTSVPWADRVGRPLSIQDPPIVYVANGFTDLSGAGLEGALAAGRVGGMVASTPITSSLTQAAVQGATAVVGPLANAAVEAAITNGAVVFTRSILGTIVVESGVTTFSQPDEQYDQGWSKIRRVRTRDLLCERIRRSWQPLVGNVTNSPIGRDTLIGLANNIIAQMVSDGALLSGVCYEDPARPPVGDSAWFVVEALDLDSLERIYLTASFQFAFTQATATAA